MSTKKYRPYFTFAELTEIYEALVHRQSDRNLELRRYIGKYLNDIQSGYRQENHTLKPTLSEKLGFEGVEVDVSTTTTQELKELEAFLLKETASMPTVMEKLND